MVQVIMIRYLPGPDIKAEGVIKHGHLYEAARSKQVVSPRAKIPVSRFGATW